VLVLGMGTLVSVMVMGVVITNRLNARQVSQGNDALRAEALAESAVEYALAKLAADANWRTTYTNNVESPSVAMAGGTMAFKLVDESTGSLTSNPTNPVRIYGVGKYGKAIKAFSVQAAGKAGLACLNAAVTTGGTFNLNRANFQANGFTLASNSTLSASSSGGGTTVNANVEAVGAITPGAATITGTSTTGVAVRGMPASTVFDYYIANGTSISYSSISGGIIQNVVLSPASNPYSLLGLFTNAKGIYVIDCQNQVLKITHCRIVGTLVILNPGSGSSIGLGTSSTTDQINWSPAVTGYPCLLVKGNINMAFCSSSGSMLTESSTGVNFNPSGTAYPYPGGASNSNTTDSYPSIIDGLVYVSGNVTDGSQPSYPVLDLLVVGGAYDANQDTITFNYTTNYLNAPPPGFASGGGQVIPTTGSWRWEKWP
jgi:hypothetical protein